MRGQCEKSVWEVNVRSQCEKSMWEVNVRSQCERSMWEVNVRSQCERSVWEVNVTCCCFCSHLPWRAPQWSSWDPRWPWKGWQWWGHRWLSDTPPPPAAGGDAAGFSAPPPPAGSFLEFRCHCSWLQTIRRKKKLIPVLLWIYYNLKKEGKIVHGYPSRIFFFFFKWEKLRNCRGMNRGIVEG